MGAEVLVGEGTDVYKVTGTNGIWLDLNYTTLESIRVMIPLAVHVTTDGNLLYPQVFVRYGI
jgi:hypothetical protein